MNIKKFIPLFLLNWYHFCLAAFAAFLYRFPSYKRRGKSKKIKVIGVTGTNGKTTAVYLTAKILESAGYKVALISSIKFKIGDIEWKNTLKMTMPGRFKLQRFLRQAVGAGCDYVVLEVTSEGIKQHRHRFIDFDVAVFTNLTPEHIEAHRGFENYRAAKGKLFQATKGIHIINLDDENTKYFLGFPSNKKYVFTARRDPTSPELGRGRVSPKLQIVKAQNCRVLNNGVKFSVNETEFNLNLLGKFNIYNALAAICVALSQGVDLETCKAGLEKVKGIPGRMEIVIREPFIVIVDYAHTPDALEKVYQTVKQVSGFKFQVSRRLICVLGAAGGGRDKWKRQEMGKIAAQYCDEIILTNEDPYDENPEKILDEIFSGFSCFMPAPHRTCLPRRELVLLRGSGAGFQVSCFRILDRREAIKKALTLAKPGDTVIVSGKGSEPWMCVAGGKKIPWDDREIIEQEFHKLRSTDARRQ